MFRSIVSRQTASYCALVPLVSSALAGCFEERSASQPEAFAVATPVSQASNQPPEINGVPTIAVESGQTYSFVPAAIDADQDFLQFEVTNKPSWAQFSDETGTLSGTPQDSDVGETTDITIAVTDGRDRRAVGPFRINVTKRGEPAASSNTPPAISGTAGGSVQIGQAYSFTPTASDANNDKLTFLISNRPSWATLNMSTGALTGTPTAANLGTYAGIVLSVSDGKQTTSLPAFTVQVNNTGNRAPTISGTPGTSVQATQAYSFAPSAKDADGDSLSYSIQNKPSWATFSASNGRLSGTPSTSNVGSYANILIKVSDGKAATSLTAFTIAVGTAPAVATTPSRTAAVTAPTGTPTISGSPAIAATVGTAYSFRPSATDPDGDTLSWSIANKPSWATFSTATGVLSGTPADAGAFSNISISVSDGTTTAALAPFAIAVGSSELANGLGSARLIWEAPTRNADDSDLTQLAGYRIVYGTGSSQLTQMIDIPGHDSTSYTVDSLTPGKTWYFAVKAYTAGGTESALSDVVSKTFP